MVTILRIKAAKELTGLRRTSIYDKIKRNEFPPPIPLSLRAVGWLLSDLDAWLVAQAASSKRRVAWREIQAMVAEVKRSVSNKATA